MNCPYCNRYNVDDAIYCRICGKELDMYEEELSEEDSRDSSEIGKNICKIGAIVLCVLAIVGTIFNVAGIPALPLVGIIAYKLWNM